MHTHTHRLQIDIAASWVTKVGGRKLQFTDRQLQISDRRDYTRSKFQFLPLHSAEMEIFGPEFCVLGRNLSDRLKFRGKGRGITVCPPPSTATTPLARPQTESTANKRGSRDKSDELLLLRSSTSVHIVGD